MSNYIVLKPAYKNSNVLSIILRNTTLIEEDFNVEYEQYVGFKYTVKENKNLEYIENYYKINMNIISLDINGLLDFYNINFVNI